MKKTAGKRIKLIFALFTMLAVLTGTALAEGYPDVYVNQSGPGGTGWEQLPSGGWMYLISGTPLRGWQSIGAHLYYFDDGGYMQKGWKTIDGVSYYFTETASDGHPSGSMRDPSTAPAQASAAQAGAQTAAQTAAGSETKAAGPAGPASGPAAAADAAAAAAEMRKNPYGHTCVEVDITNQTVYIYQGENLVITSPCVTGYKGVHDTTPGDWAIRYKETDTYLTGPTWRSHVDFWMPFHGGMGLHDANWRGTSHANFGGQIYTYDGSHGCVNLPHDVAEQLYAMAYEGMPVHVHL